MDCTTRKTCYNTKEQAEDALLRARAQYPSSSGAGPVAVYHCAYCSCYHLTSKGEVSDLLRSKNTRQKIDLQREANYWESKMKGR
ncbi:hypothetical protein [Fulvivirga imtechensis]|uniref:hypothetical protein n=1 Tax=Fulvivirga imtechensis TaxID=881893 RepID=UPI0012F75FDA|nr:hypothetical protein [Fulvivirga imtechensis]